MSLRRLPTLVAWAVLPALLWPAASVADHITTSATVSARLKERRSTDFWVVEIDWTAGCTGAAPGTAWYDGDLYLVDADTGGRNGRRELVRCGSGRDRARVDRRDRVRACERVSRRR